MPLEIVIVGAGIGGLAAATGFRRDGHRVTIVEQADVLSEVGAAIGMGPNATGSLSRLGIVDRLETEAVRPRAWTRRRWSDGAILGAYNLRGVVEERFGHPFWMLHRGDLHRALIYGATSPDLAGKPAILKLSSRVTAVQSYSDHSEIVTENGERFVGDLVIGADGVHSRVRDSIFGRDEPIFGLNAVVRVQLPIRDMLGSNELRAFAEDENIETWMGPNAHILHAPIRAGTIFNFAVCLTETALSEKTWFTAGDKALLLDRLAGWYPPILHIIERGELVGRWDLYDRNPLDAWYSGRTCLLGDAAHAMLPYLGQGGAQTLEDAVALVDALAGVTRDLVPEALARYEAFRKPRATIVQQTSRSRRDFYHMPDGPAQRARDAEYVTGEGDFEDYNWIWKLPDITRPVGVS